MNAKGFEPLTIGAAIVVVGILTVAGLWGANAAGILGEAKSGEGCGLPLPRPCVEGTVCHEGVCHPIVGFEGWLQRFLSSINLNNLLCKGGSLFGMASCNVVINVGGAVLLGALAVLLTIIWLKDVPNLYLLLIPLVLGGFIGLALSSVITYWYWAIILIIAVLVFAAYKFEIIGK